MSLFDSNAVRTFRSIVACVTWYVVFSLVAPPVAFANGRYPLAQQVLVDPSDIRHLYLRSTYGVLMSSDAGTTWAWLCESGIGYDPGEDPTMAIVGDGSVLAGAFEGLFTTRDRGCSWRKDDAIGQHYVNDLAVVRDGVTVLAATVNVRSNGRFEAQLWRSIDGAMTWSSYDIGTESLLPFTLDAAPSDPQRVYVTAANVPMTPDAGLNAGTGVILRSTDGGKTFAESPIPGTDRYNPPLIAAIDPSNPDVLYVRVQGDQDTNNLVASWLLYSKDAGRTWRELFRAKADMLGFALSSEGGTVLIGMGDTRNGARPVDTSVIGLYRANSGSLSFSRVSNGQVGCLTYSGNNLYVCGSQQTSGYELGISNDDGTTISPLFEYGTVQGPLVCPADTPQAMICTAQWPYACAGLGHCPHVDAGASAPSAGGSSGCCGSAASKSKPQSEIGTKQLDMLPGAHGLWLVVTALLAGALRRRMRPRTS